MILLAEPLPMTRPSRATDNQAVADVLRELRDRADLTQEELARRVGLTLSGYRTYEQGKRSLKNDQIPRFAEALGVPVSDITARLWPDAGVAERRFSADWESIQREVEGLPPEVAERVLRNFRTAVDIATSATRTREN